jgi:hypothetical protein
MALPVVIAILLLILSAPACAQIETILTDWLVAGPAWVPEKAFSDTAGNRETKALETPLVD